MLLTVIEKLLVKSYASIRRTVSSDPTVRTSPRSLAAQPMPTMATVSNKMATISIVQGSRLKVACRFCLPRSVVITELSALTRLLPSWFSP